MANTNDKNEIKYNKLIGRIGDEYYFLDSVFSYKDGMKGATGSRLEALSKEKFDERVENYFDPENMRELWQMAVGEKQTDLGLDDWIDFVKDTDGESIALDDSYSGIYQPQLIEKLGEKSVYATNCTGGGRCFNPEMEWDELFDPKLWELIKQYETN